MQSGVIFDWDGIIVNAAEIHGRCWELLAKERNLLLPENHFKLGFKARNEDVISHSLCWSEDPIEIQKISEQKEEIFRKIIEEEGIDPEPGVRHLLEDLKQRQILCAIASSSCRANIDLALEIMDLHTCFSGIITEESVSVGKVSPNVFLQAALALELAPKNIVVVEDSIAGIETALADGFKVLAVATTNPETLLSRTQAHSVVARVSDINVGLINALLRT